MKALYEFFRPGASVENIQYLSSARDDIQAGHSEHSEKQSLKTIDEFFSYINCVASDKASPKYTRFSYGNGNGNGNDFILRG